jgi:3D (Asp-Asp-Asp) domain-containing protein
MKKLIKFGKDLWPLSRQQHSLLIIIIALSFQFLFFAMPSLADEINAQVDQPQSMENLSIKNDSLAKSTTADSSISQIIQDKLDKQAEASNKSETKIEKVISTSVRKLTAYNSEVGQTDDSPCTTATGFNVCQYGVEDTIAANFLEMGTRVRIPELFGDRIFVVRDRMHPKNGQKVDVWMKNHTDAVKFGVKIAKIEVLE